MIESEGSKIPDEIAKFKVDVSTSNVWHLPVSMAEYLSKHMHILISEEEIRKNLQGQSCPSQCQGTPLFAVPPQCRPSQCQGAPIFSI